MIIKTESENKIAKEFFKEFTTSSEVTRTLYPNSKSKSVGVVTDNFNELKYSMDEERKPICKQNKKGKNKGKLYYQIIPQYRLNLNFFFDYSKTILPRDTFFTDKEKEHLTLIVKDRDIRKIILDYPPKSLIEKVKYFFLDYLNSSNAQSIDSHRKSPPVEKQLSKNLNLIKKHSIVDSVKRVLTNLNYNPLIIPIKIIDAQILRKDKFEKEKQTFSRKITKMNTKQREIFEFERDLKNKINLLFGFGEVDLLGKLMTLYHQKMNRDIETLNQIQNQINS